PRAKKHRRARLRLRRWPPPGLPWLAVAGAALTSVALWRLWRLWRRAYEPQPSPEPRPTYAPLVAPSWRCRDLMRRDVVTVRADEPVLHAARRMRAAGIGFLPVVDAAARPLGAITDRDIAVRLIA